MSMVNIKVRRQSFKISCAVGEEAAMRHAAVTVEKKIEAAREQSGIADGERTAIMAALMLAYENDKNANAKAESAAIGDGDKKLIDKMNRKLEAVLLRTEPPQGRVRDNLSQ